MPPAQDLESVYFDTEDFALRQRGVTLRVRKKGKSYIQTLKIANEHAGGVFSRGEWESPVTGALPDLAAIDDRGSSGLSWRRQRR